MSKFKKSQPVGVDQDPHKPVQAHIQAESINRIDKPPTGESQPAKRSAGKPSTPSIAEQLLPEALRLCRLGWHILPIQNVYYGDKWHKAPPKGLGRYKKWQTQQPDEKQLHAWFTLPGITGLAVLLTNGHCVRDFDEAGSYECWKNQNSELAAQLPTVKTGRGHQVHFLGEGKKTIALGDGEFRAGPCLCVLPPSFHPLGVAYEWIVPLLDGPLPMVDDGIFLAAGSQLPLPAILAPSRQSVKPDESVECDEVDPLHVDHDEPLVVSPQSIEALIKQTLPDGPDQRNHRVFLLSLGMRDLGFKNPRQCEPHVRNWWKRCVEVIEHKEWATTWAAFIAAWLNYDREKRKIPSVIKRAEDKGYPREILETYGSAVARVAAICRELQRDTGDSSFFLTARALSHEGMNPKTMDGYLKILRVAGYIRLVRKGRREKGKKSKGSTFRYLRPLDEVTHLTYETYQTHNTYQHINSSVGGEGVEGDLAHLRAPKADVGNKAA